MTFTELHQHENVSAAERVRGGALLTYTALGEGDCDQCEELYLVGDMIIGFHPLYPRKLSRGLRRQYEPEVEQTFCSRACAVCWMEMRHG